MNYSIPRDEGVEVEIQGKRIKAEKSNEQKRVVERRLVTLAFEG